MINLLIAIDGTESKGYSHRWIEEFYNSFEVNSDNGDSSINKYYNPGPYTYSFGERNCNDIYIDCTIWLARAIILHYSHFIKKKDEKNLQIIRERELNKGKSTGRAGGYYNLFDILKSFENSGKIEKFVNENIQISIVGHSRGGHVAIALNNSIPFKVFFLGLLDPVDWDMSLVIETEEIKTNWKYIYHAIRSKLFAVDSSQLHDNSSYTLSARGYFGYDGLKNRAHSVEEYNTSHGGMGGSQLPNGNLILKDDITCSEIYREINQCYSITEAEQQTPINLMDRHQSLYTAKSQPEINFKINGHEYKVNRIRKLNADCFNESNRIRNDFFNAAIKAGLKIHQQ